MKKIVFILFFCFFNLFAKDFLNVQDINVANSNNKDKVYNLVQKYIALNKQLAEYKQNDLNSSIHDNFISDIQNQKEEILSKIPSVIVNEKINKNEVDKFLSIKKTLIDKQNSFTKQDYDYIMVGLDLAYLEIVENFYSSLFKLEILFKEAASSAKIRYVVNTALENQNNINFNFNNLKANIKDVNKLEKIIKKENELINQTVSYREILIYLRDNADLLESNFFFSVLGIGHWINVINDKVHFEYINVGKIVISILILMLFFSLRKAFSHIVYFILVKVIYRQKEEAQDIKDMFIEKIKKPIGFLLLVYSVSICISIMFYPAPAPIKLINYFYIIYAVLFAWLTINSLDSYGVILVAKLAQKSGKKEIINLIIKMLYFVIIVFALLFILSQLGFNVSAIIASLGIGGLAVALAAKDMIANFFASIMLLFDDSFNQGDWIEVGGIEGTVVETGLRKTTIRTFDNSLVFFPNSTIMGANIINWSKRRIGRRIRMYLGVTYSATPEQLDQCVKDLREYINTTPLVAHEDDCALRYGDSKAKYKQNLVSVNDLEGYKNTSHISLSDFGESSINIEVYFYVKAIGGEDFRRARHTIMLEFMRIIAKNGLSFAFPSRSLYVETLSQNDIKQA